MRDRWPQWSFWLRRLAPLGAIIAYLALTLPQLDLPGLHYDEAKEAGVNAMQMLLRQDVYAFRSAGLQLGSVFLPIMVQDYIGALNVYLALPFLAIFGVTVQALRLLPVTCGLLTLLLAGGLGRDLAHLPWPAQLQQEDVTDSSEKISWAGPLAMWLLALSPSFVFWSHQGIFVTNIVVTLAMATVWLALRWWQLRQPRHLYLFAFLAGVGLWAKLLFVWVLGGLAGMAVLAWLAGKRAQSPRPANPHPWRHGLVAAGLFLLGISPLLLFNQQTFGTLSSIFGNLGQSYYGVDNTAFLTNVGTRFGQVMTVLRGDHFWYLGGPFANQLAPWLASAIILVALIWKRARHPGFLASLIYVTLLILQSSFTVSDLFVTHFAIIQPFLLLTVALAADQILQNTLEHAIPATAIPSTREPSRVAQGIGWTTLAALLLWLVADLQVNARYHQAMAITGGLASHSDAIQGLADWLEDRDHKQPVALDWGVEAPVRYLTTNRVQPLELFGYDRLETPNAGFAERLAPFLQSRDQRYVLHTREDTVFQGRREVLEFLASQQGLTVVEEAVFRERNGRPVFVVLQLE